MVLSVPSVADRHLLNRFSFGASRPLVNQSAGKGGAPAWFAWQLYPKSITKPQLRTMLVPRPTTAVVGGRPIRDEELLRWARDVIDTVVDRAPVAAR